MKKAIRKSFKEAIANDDTNMSELFNQMMGTGSINLTIAYPRYKTVMSLIESLLRLSDVMATSPFMAQPDYADDRDDIVRFIASSRARLDEFSAEGVAKYEHNLQQVPEEERKSFADMYDKLKKSDLVNTFVMMCDRLIPHKRYLQAKSNAKDSPDNDKLSSVFIDAMPGVAFAPFPFTKLNFKQIFAASNLSETTRRFFLVVLSKALELSHSLWKEITSPDVNVDEFTNMIMNSIKDIQKQPELHRCKQAFKKIEDSIHLLKDRFGNYYRDFVQTKNNTIMMEHFILDVSKETKASPEVTRQFRQIIMFYRKNAQQVNNPRIKMLFDRVNGSFMELERNTNNLTSIAPDDEAATEDKSEDITGTDQ